MTDDQHGETPTSEPGAPGAEATPGAPGDDETRVLPGADDETRVLPGGEDETKVMPGEDTTRVAPGSEAPTRVMATPPPLGSGVWTSPAPPDGARGPRRPPRIVWFALLGIAVGLLLAIAAGLLLRGPKLEPFLGTWGPAEGGAGPLGGLVIESGVELASVTAYSALTESLGAVEAAWDGDDLRATVPGGGSLMDTDGPATLRIAYDEDDDRLVVTIETANGSAVQSLARVSALAPGPAETAPAPAQTPTPTPTPTVTGSPDASPSPTTSPDDEVRNAITRIQVGVLTWASEHAGLFPPAPEVSADGEVGQYVDPWPTNPFTSAPMQAGSAPGDYTYEQLEAGRAYLLTGFLSDGATVVVP